jgi:Rod binding domain-containing protein
VSTVSGSSSSLMLSSVGASAASALAPLGTPTLGKGAKAAREFEAQLIGSVLESLEKTFASIPGEDTMAGADNYNYMGTQALASVMAAGGGFGIAKLISEHFGGTKAPPVGTTPTELKPASGH